MLAEIRSLFRRIAVAFFPMNKLSARPSEGCAFSGTGTWSIVEHVPLLFDVKAQCGAASGQGQRQEERRSTHSKQGGGCNSTERWSHEDHDSLTLHRKADLLRQAYNIPVMHVRRLGCRRELMNFSVLSKIAGMTAVALLSQSLVGQ